MTEQEQSILAEEVTNPENSPVILTAEELAYAHVDMEISFASAEKDKRGQVIEDIFRKYPNIAPYRPIFEEVINRFAKADSKINDLWQEFVGKDKQLPKADVLVPLNLPQANPESSAALAQDIFGNLFQHKVKALHEYGILTLFVSSADMANIDVQWFGDADHIDPSSGHCLFVEGMPIILIEESGSLDDDFGVYLHEKRHAYSRLFQAAKAGNIMKAHEGRGDLDREVINRLIKDVVRVPEQEGTAKSEVLAYFTNVWIIDLGSHLSKNPEQETTAEGIVDFFGELVTEEMSDGGSYHLGGDKPVRKATEAAKALAELRDLYKSSNPAFVADEIVMALLEQFPLKSWPAVNHMLQKAHLHNPVPKLEVYP